MVEKGHKSAVKKALGSGNENMDIACCSAFLKSSPMKEQYWKQSKDHMELFFINWLLFTESHGIIQLSTLHRPTALVALLCDCRHSNESKKNIHPNSFSILTRNVSTNGSLNPLSSGFIIAAIHLKAVS